MHGTAFQSHQQHVLRAPPRCPAMASDLPSGSTVLQLRGLIRRGHSVIPVGRAGGGVQRPGLFSNHPPSCHSWPQWPFTRCYQSFRERFATPAIRGVHGCGKCTERIRPAAATTTAPVGRQWNPMQHFGWARLRWTPSGLQKEPPFIHRAMHLNIVKLRVRSRASTVCVHARPRDHPRDHERSQAVAALQRHALTRRARGHVGRPHTQGLGAGGPAVALWRLCVALLPESTR